jgi:hypothetical protein
MTNENLRADIARQLLDCGVKIIAIPGGYIQLLGRYNSILLSHDLLTLNPKHLERLCGENA